MEFKNFLIFLVFLAITQSYAISSSRNPDDNDEIEQTLMTIRNAEVKMKHALKSIIKQSLPYVMKIFEEVNVSSSCLKASTHFLRDLIRLKGWTYQLLDSIGKPAAGILGGSPWFRGDYDQCLDIVTHFSKRKSANKETIRGKFCAVSMKFPSFNQETIKLISRYGNISLIQLIREIIKPLKLSRLYEFKGTIIQTLRFDVCIPSMCNENDLQSIGHWVIGDLLHVDYCKTMDDKLEISIAQLICIISFGLFLIWVSLAAILEVLTKYTSSKEKYLSLFHLLENIFYEIFLQVFVIIESFFFFSGFLTFHSRETNQRPIIYYVQFIIKRINRLTLPVMCSLLLCIVLPLLGDGPHSQVLVDHGKLLERNWWMYVIHVQNIFERESFSSNHQFWIVSNLGFAGCYIGSVDQVYVIQRWPKSGIVVTSALILTGIATDISDLYTGNYYAVVSNANKLLEYRNHHYVLPWFSHMSTYFLGVLFGCLLPKNKTVRFQKKTLIVLWIASLALLGLSIFSLFKLKNEDSPNENYLIAFQSFAPLAWTLGLSWICVACITGYGGMINRFFSSDVFVILDHLNIWIYLIHAPVIFYISANIRNSIVLTKMNLWMIFFFVLFLTVITSMVFYVFIESPINNLLSKLLKILSSKKVVFNNKNENKKMQDGRYSESYHS
ncbi:nose resistant to fluoxetine protein 6-like [Centruroides sculpturatus]|uniref:nose resistant to fluoxetine protein 6-like n=1 Tax=Centruroides sculpturatus TaxID=218467 RepID=UPI000C6CCE3D|nr:nose resistant to fluoxetine protein 6-like [Centruroides sculpturatus]